MNKVYYLSYYNKPELNGEKRLCLPSAVNKMDYIISCLNSDGYDVDVVSASGALENNSYRGSKTHLDNRNTLCLFASVGRGNLLKKAIDIFSIRMQLVFFMLREVKPDSVVICYHSMGYVRLLAKLKKLLRFKLILEVEEIYSDVNESFNGRKAEEKLFGLADAFLFPTQMLNDQINQKTEKPFCIVHGRYQNERHFPSVFDSEKKHIVYAGILDPRKGCISAVNAAKYLDEQYHIHIIGIGDKKDVEDLEKAIEETSKETTCGVSFDGLKSGDEYLQFLQSCYIGLSPQNPEAKFNGTSFPSKVLSYLSNGLSVVSINIPSIKNSEVSDLISFYNEQTSQEIAHAIQSVKITDKAQIAERLEKLDREFKKDLDGIIKRLIER